MRTVGPFLTECAKMSGVASTLQNIWSLPDRSETVNKVEVCHSSLLYSFSVVIAQLENWVSIHTELSANSSITTPITAADQLLSITLKYRQPVESWGAPRCGRKATIG